MLYVTLFAGGALTNVSSVIMGGANSVLNFNGGTLAASTNGNLITTNSTTVNATNYVQAGGATINSVTYTVTNALPLVQDPNSPGGGLTKLGSGSLTLLGNSTYTGPTTVSGGTLLVNGSIGTNSVIVQSGASLGGTGSIGGNVTFASGALGLLTNGATMTISGSLTLNNNTVQLNLPANLGVGSYLLATYNPNGSSGSFATNPVVATGSFLTNVSAVIITGGGSVVLQVTFSTTTALFTSANLSVFGLPVTYTATVLFTNGAITTGATSNYVFWVDGVAVATNAVSGGQATYTTSTLALGNHTIMAVYVGDGIFQPSTNSLTQTVNVPVPPPNFAAAVGYTNNTFSSTFNASQVDMTNTLKPGYNWYLAQPFSHYVTPASSIVMNGDGSGTFENNSNGSPWSAGFPNGGSDGRWVGTVFGGGGYFEATLKFDPNTVTNTSAGWPAWWSLAIEHCAYMPQQQWPGQVTNYMHFIEPDFFEWDVPTYGNPQEESYGGAMHDWSGVYTTNGYPYNVAQPWPGFVITTPSATDFTQYHKYGWLWVPATATKNGYAQYYFDGQFNYRHGLMDTI